MGAAIGFVAESLVASLWKSKCRYYKKADPFSAINACCSADIHLY
jgi:hypothetical protein